MPTRTGEASADAGGEAPPFSCGIRVDSGRGVEESIVLFAAGGGESGIANKTLHLVERCAVRSVCGRHDVLFHHQRAEVVAAEAQSDLPDLHPHRNPARLEVRHVVQHYPRESNRTQIFTRASLRLVGHRRGVLRLERPTNESGEAARARLNFLYSLQM